VLVRDRSVQRAPPQARGRVSGREASRAVARNR
jgi:hypothetical protein